MANEHNTPTETQEHNESGVGGIIDLIPRGDCPRDVWAAMSVTDGTERTAVAEVGAIMRRSVVANIAAREGLRMAATDIDAFTLVAGFALQFAASEIMRATEITMRAYAQNRLPAEITEAYRGITSVLASIDAPWYKMIHAAANASISSPEMPVSDAERRAHLTGAEICAGSNLLSLLAHQVDPPMLNLPTALVLEGMCVLLTKRMNIDEEGDPDARAL